MKDALKEKFKYNTLVKPLYRKLKYTNKIKPRMFISIASTFKLDGHGTSARGNAVTHNDDVEILKDKNELTRSKKNVMFLCNTCETYDKDCCYEKVAGMKRDLNDARFESNGRNLLETAEIGNINKCNKLNPPHSNIEMLDKVPNIWLRLYPAPKLPQESLCSVIFRCIFCQLGIFTFLVLWTTIFIFVIHYFEGPHEIKLSMDFEKQQNQLVIDLATELRQITPISPRWKAAIKKRLEDAIHTTSVAVLRGARLRPGHYWDLSGTFLFTVYAMTTLGFGAPLPQTIEGRTSAFIYAILAVPSHFYLLLNLSTSIVTHIEVYIKQLRSRLQDKMIVVDTAALDNGSPNCSRHSELLKAPKKCIVGKKIMLILGLLGVGRGVPLAGVLYYATGACIFGVSRHLRPLAIVMFPIEFTTSGGLDVVECHVRILYGIYIEGAMILIACALATLRRQSTLRIKRISKKYRLFASEK